MILGRDTEDLGDDERGQLVGDVRHQVHVAPLPDPLHQPDDLVRFLTHQVRDGPRKVVLLPTSDLFFLFLSRHRAQLADKYLMNLPPEDVAESVVNKRRLYELAAAKGLAIVAGTQRRHDPKYIETMKRILTIMLNGDPMPNLLMHIIRFVMPSKSKPLKKRIPPLDPREELERERDAIKAAAVTRRAP